MGKVSVHPISQALCKSATLQPHESNNNGSSFFGRSRHIQHSSIPKELR